MERKYSIKSSYVIFSWLYSYFLNGGLTGLFLGNVTVDVPLSDTYFVVALSIWLWVLLLYLLFSEQFIGSIVNYWSYDE